MVRVVIADASAAARRLLADMLTLDPAFAVVGEANDGPTAVAVTRRLRPDVVLMDVDIAGNSDFAATKQIMIEIPTPIVIVSAAPSARQAETSMLALRTGALTILNKPVGPVEAVDIEERRRFATTVKAMSQVKVVRHWPARNRSGAERPVGPRAAPRRRIVAIAASTGGPAAIMTILAQLPADFPTPIMVVQHMASGFIDGFAKWLDTGCALRVKVAEHGEPLVGHTVFVAPDNRQLGLSLEGNVELSNQAPVDGFRPSATYLFRSVARLASSSAIAVMLTGMGRDGVEGLRDIRSGGGLVLVQDEQSSVVFGMPAAAISAGCADHVLPLAAMAPRLMETIG
jgi:two-component system chemotaxis response regulator CheB